MFLQYRPINYYLAAQRSLILLQPLQRSPFILALILISHSSYWMSSQSGGAINISGHDPISEEIREELVEAPILVMESKE